MALACGGTPDEPITAAEFCDEASPKFQEIRDQFDQVVTTANRLNTLNAITVTRSMKIESQGLNTLSIQARQISTNITMAEPSQEAFDTLGETYRDHTGEMFNNSALMVYGIGKYAEEGKPEHLDAFIRGIGNYRRNYELAELLVLVTCTPDDQPNSG